MFIRSILVLLLPLAATDAVHLYHNDPPTLLAVPQNTSFTLDSFNSTARPLPVPATKGAEWTLLSPFLLGGTPGEPLRVYKISSPSPSSEAGGGRYSPLKRVELVISGNDKALAHSGSAGFITSNDNDGHGEGDIYLLGGESDGMHTGIQLHISPDKGEVKATVEQHAMGLPPASGFTLTPLRGGRQVLLVGGVAAGKEMPMGSIGVRDVDAASTGAGSSTSRWQFVRAAGGDSIGGRSGHTAVGHGAHVYVYGGWRSDGKLAQPQLAVLDTDAWRWSVPSESGLGPRTGSRHAAAMLDGGVMLIVGRDVGLFDTAELRWVAAYFPGQSGAGSADAAWKRQLGVTLGVTLSVTLAAAAAGATVRVYRRRRHKRHTAKEVLSNDSDGDEARPLQQQWQHKSSTLIPPALTAAKQLARSTSAPQPLLPRPQLLMQLLPRRPASLPGEIGCVETGTLMRGGQPGSARTMADLPPSPAPPREINLLDGGETGDEGGDEDEEDGGYQTADEDVLTASRPVTE